MAELRTVTSEELREGLQKLLDGHGPYSAFERALRIRYTREELDRREADIMEEDAELNGMSE